MDEKNNVLLNEQNNERLLINILRGIAIFLMIWGHLIQHISVGFNGFDLPVHRVIYSFHMPLFMLISGYLFYKSSLKYSFKELLYRRAKSLIYPIVACKIIGFFLVTCLMDLIFEHDFHTIFSGGWVLNFSGPWFLWSVFSATLVLTICTKLTKNKLIIILMMICGFLIVAVFPNKDRNIFMYPYFIIGYAYAKYKKNILKSIKIIVGILASIAFLIMIPYYETKHYIYISGIYSTEYSILDNLLINIYRYAIGLLGSIMIIFLVSSLLSFIIYKSKKQISNNIFVKAIEGIGKHSLQIYILSSIFESWIIILFTNLMPAGNIFFTNTWLYSLIYTPVVAIIYTAGLYWTSKLLYRIKIGKYIFAR